MTEITIPFNDRLAGPYTATADQTAFTYDFPIRADADLKVVRNRAGVVTVLTLTTEYSVSGAGDQNGGTVTLVTGATAGDIISIYGNLTKARSTDFAVGGPYKAANINLDLDNILMMLQELARDVSRKVGLDDAASATTLTIPIGETNKQLILDGSGNIAARQYFQFHVGASEPAASISEEGDLWFDSDSTDGDLYQYVSSSWTDTGNDLKGPQGDQGIQGIQGDQGDQGIQGIQGDQGIQGIQGETGAVVDIFVQASAPATTGETGSLWIDSDSTDLDLYQLSAGDTWDDTGVNLKGSTGAQGPNGADAGFDLTWRTATSGDPGAGGIRGNNDDQSLITEFAIDDVDRNGENIEGALQALDDSTSSIKGMAWIVQTNDKSKWIFAEISANFSDQTGYWTVTAAIRENGAAIDADAVVSCLIIPKGDKGDQGIPGPATVVDDTVRVAAGANRVIANELEAGDTVDSTTLVAGDLVLLFGQTDPAENGIYVVQASGAALRETDYDTYDEHPGKLITVQEGAVRADKIYHCTSDLGGTLGVTAIDWEERFGAASETVSGLVELSSNAEAAAGVDTSRALTPANVASMIGSVLQGYDLELAALASLASNANLLPYFTGSGTAATTPFSAFGRSLIDDADAATMRQTLGLVIGTDVQAQDAELAAIAGLTSAADKLPYFTGSGTAALADLTSFARTLLDDANAGSARATILAEQLGVARGVETKTANYTLVLNDAGKTIEMNLAGANTLTVPPNSSVAFTVGTYINVSQYGAGQCTITPGSGVTLRNANGLKTAAQYSMATLYKRGTDEWLVGGDLSA